jgi:hypothetical protein
VPGPRMQPPWEFLLAASRNSLQSYELSRLSHAANLRKEIGALLDEWLDENACAMLARWLIEKHERPLRDPKAAPADESLPPHGHCVSDNLFANGGAAPPVNRGSA